VEDPSRRAGACPQRLREHVTLAPSLEHLELERRQLLSRIDLAAGDQGVVEVCRHGRPILGGAPSGASREAMRRGAPTMHVCGFACTTTAMARAWPTVRPEPVRRSRCCTPR